METQFLLTLRDRVVRKNLPLLSSILRFDRKCSELGPPIITKAGSAPGTAPFFFIEPSWRNCKMSDLICVLIWCSHHVCESIQAARPTCKTDLGYTFYLQISICIILTRRSMLYDAKIFKLQYYTCIFAAILVYSLLYLLLYLLLYFYKHIRTLTFIHTEL